MSLAGRRAVITGGGRGIGAAIARALADAGVGVLVAARSHAEIEAVANGLRAQGHRASAATADVTRPDSIQALARTAAEVLGDIDILINNAGSSSSAPLKRTTLEEWNRLFAVNATSTFLCTQAFLPGMLERKWGRVVNVASVAGLHGAKYIAAYSAAKHAVIGFTKSMAAEVEGTGVTLSAVCPGYVDTPMTDQSLERMVQTTGRTRAEALAAVLGHSGQARLITPEEVATTVVDACAANQNGAIVELRDH
ncbi:MAG TPA: SDR family oxidoreductase [Gemmatimonadales bacterium]|nr:SDR family oxidoreductase [Gemmatimonadales bacterium]